MSGDLLGCLSIHDFCTGMSGRLIAIERTLTVGICAAFAGEVLG